jgi:hypothetical protein
MNRDLEVRHSQIKVENKSIAITLKDYEGFKEMQTTQVDLLYLSPLF